jgi:hypothetical protein
MYELCTCIDDVVFPFYVRLEFPAADLFSLAPRLLQRGDDSRALGF